MYSENNILGAESRTNELKQIYIVEAGNRAQAAVLKARALTFTVFPGDLFSD